MARSFWQSLLTWFAGCAIGLIITSIVFKIGWKDKESILIWGYGGLFSIVVMYVTYNSQIKKKEMEDIDKKLQEKADVKDVAHLKEIFQNMNQSIENIQDAQAETRHTIGKIYDMLLNKKVG